jgi:hypothetical protein
MQAPVVVLNTKQILMTTRCRIRGIHKRYGLPARRPVVVRTVQFCPGKRAIETQYDGAKHSHQQPKITAQCVLQDEQDTVETKPDSFPDSLPRAGSLCSGAIYIRCQQVCQEDSRVDCLTATSVEARSSSSIFVLF